jgi:hypothetical protein
MKAMTRQIGHPLIFCAPTLDVSNGVTITIMKTLIKSMELGASEDDARSAGHETFCLLCNSKVSNLSQLNPVHFSHFISFRQI